ncbi:DUF4336 domain-containing protein [Massilia sp. TS11]|uniref:DUF4336 domain-containing protein n=1 Tax=Massilia sp. TS11 TaxID=2908003 RepID=UPI001EDB0393|nr:DUF4336 domain-containing protein [Massilia sp. TS11]MCG2584137.1 DUF4336 domain-containing protein [Massilia sp. TS11]
MPLSEVVPGRIWCSEQLLAFGPIQLATRMTLVRLADGGLWVHSPIRLSDALREEVARLGEVRYVVAPNKGHHLFFSAFLAAFPHAQGWIAPGLAEKRPDLAHLPVLRDDTPWASELVPQFIEGLPLLNETVWFHAPSGSLILTDLLFCVGPNPSWLVRTLGRLLGIYGKLGMSATMKLAVKDRAALAASVAPLLRLPVGRVILAHDQIVVDDAKVQLSSAFAWLSTAPR